MNTTGRMAKLAILLSAAGVVLAGCASDRGDIEAQESPSDAPAPQGSATPDVQENSESVTQEDGVDEEPEVQPIPVGDAFGEAIWSLSVGSMSDVWVRDDRLIVSDVESGRVFAVEAGGDEIWSFDLPEKPSSMRVVVGKSTVALLTGAEVEGEGLAEKTFAAHVALRAIEDGSLIAEDHIPLASAQSSLPSDLVGDGFYMTQDGVVHEFPEEYSAPMATAGDKPFVEDVLLWDESGGFGLVSETWRNDDYSFLDGLVDVARGRILVRERAVPAPEGYVGSMLDVRTGEVLFDISCPEDLRAFGDASSSPSGEFMVSGPLWVSGSEGRCIGGGEGEQSVELTAVADDGTAFGMSEEGSLVVAEPSGEVAVSELPDGAGAPFAVMSGNTALHRSGGTITANPIL